MMKVSSRKLVPILLTITMIWCGMVGFVRAQEFLKTPDGVIAEGVTSIPNFLASRFQTAISTDGQRFIGWTADRKAIIGRDRDYFFQYGITSERIPVDLNLKSGTVPTFSPTVNEQVAYLNDSNGNEIYQLFLRDIASKKTLQLSKQDEVERVGSFLWLANGRELVFTNHKKKENVTEVIVVSVDGKETRLLTAYPSETLYLTATAAGRIILRDYLPGFKSKLIAFDIKSGLRTQLTDGGAFEDSVQISPDAASVWFLGTRNSNEQKLTRYSFASGKTTQFSNGPNFIEDFAVSPNQKLVALKVVDSASEELRMFRLIDDRLSEEIRFGDSNRGGVIGRIEWRDNDEFGFDFQTPDRPSEMRVIKIASKDLQVWGKSQSPVSNLSDVEVKQIHWPSFDGTRISGFMMTPGNVIRESGLPVLIDIHGGPTARHKPDFSARDLFFATELSFAMVFPNIRGSSGFGKDFEDLDNGAKRGDAVQDILTLLDWIKKQPGLDSKRVFLRGSSYGGFIALAAGLKAKGQIKGIIAEYPLISIREDVLKNSGNIRELWESEYGRLDDELVMSKVESLSLLNADLSKWEIPVLFAVGKNDTRISPLSVQKVKDRLEANGVRVGMVESSREGHGFTDYETFRFWISAQLTFLKTEAVE